MKLWEAIKAIEEGKSVVYKEDIVWAHFCKNTAFSISDTEGYTFKLASPTPADLLLEKKDET